MGRCRVVVPESVRIPISDGDWIDVKKRLNYGEKAAASSAVIQDIRQDGRWSPNTDMLAGMAQIMAYLVDWSLVDLQGKQISIVSEPKKLAAIKAQDEATVTEIEEAITKHREQMEAEEAAAKNARDGGNASSTTSSSAA